MVNVAIGVIGVLLLAHLAHIQVGGLVTAVAAVGLLVYATGLWRPRMLRRRRDDDRRGRR